MSADIISFDAVKATRYLEQALFGFLNDPADSEHQRGFLCALLVVYEEGLGRGHQDDRITLLRAQAGIPAPVIA
jgi:hypothetical protein